ncbi:M14 family metallopeptidase [Salinimicrobium xinjiangense]|uniref:M14 family metallopeptidase n=1 Tax=Salinimicrobium xinjiangense TaxID=438596 RepID=UPI00041AA8DF|nr:M14 metallopeptidase family protein [Salinimicrobium xinjiangense]
MNIADSFLQNYHSFKADVSGRFLSYKELSPQLKKLGAEFRVTEIGRSFLNVPIESVKIGSGPVKILAWSQMHGNETTTTKGLLDLLNFFSQFKDEKEVQQVLNDITLLIIPMLNPDGAARYTRENVNKTDLNRDACDLHEPESRVLRTCFKNFQPDFCFNLHDQRTIFGAGKERNPASLSFLAPSMDEERTLTEVRENAMKLIVAMNKALQGLIPGQVGRFDDSFNINCTGDYFQAQHVPTILFECGHFPGDYQREKTRELFTYSLVVALQAIQSKQYLKEAVDDYFAIPENSKSFYDVILRNVVVKGQELDIAFQFKEIIRAGEIDFLPQVQTMAPRLSVFGHQEIDAKGGVVKNLDKEELSENDIVEVILLNNEKLSIKTL